MDENKEYVLIYKSRNNFNIPNDNIKLMSGTMHEIKDFIKLNSLAVPNGIYEKLADIDTAVSVRPVE